MYGLQNPTSWEQTHTYTFSLAVVALLSPTSWLFCLFVKSKPSFLPRIRTHNPGHVLFFSAGFLFFSFYIKHAASLLGLHFLFYFLCSQQRINQLVDDNLPPLNGCLSLGHLSKRCHISKF